MTAIACIFCVVINATLIPLLFAIRGAVIYKINNSSIRLQAKKIVSTLITIILSLIVLNSTYFLFQLALIVCSTQLGCYIAAIIYTLLLSILSSSKIYLSPEVKVDTAFKAFKKSFTISSGGHIFSILYLRVIIEVAYLLFLVLAQVEELGFCAFSDEVSFFFTINKYGIVILVAIEKILKFIEGDRKRRKILSDTFVEQETQADKEREELRQAFKEVRELIKKRRQEKTNKGSFGERK